MFRNNMGHPASMCCRFSSIHCRSKQKHAKYWIDEDAIISMLFEAGWVQTQILTDAWHCWGLQGGLRWRWRYPAPEHCTSQRTRDNFVFFRKYRWCWHFYCHKLNIVILCWYFAHCSWAHWKSARIQGFGLRNLTKYFQYYLGNNCHAKRIPEAQLK